MFAVCEPNANGLLGALENTGLAGKVKAVVFDPSPSLIRGLGDGKIHGIVLQDPVTMGYEGVKTMVAHLEGKEVERRIVTGEYVATLENMDSDQMRKLLEPEQYQDDGFRPADVKYRIAVIPKGTTHEFWKSVHAGAPLDSQALIAPVEDAKQQGIPTVIFDSGLADESIIVSYVATDNYHGGALAARRLAEVLETGP
jgi:ribose transport system substrate-binding protein